jgi:FHS family glucose/mannose:H+ symporter-like MFS transporter
MASAASTQTTFRITTRGTALLHLNFLLTGIVMTFLGPMLPILASRWAMSDAVSGRLYLTQFISSMFGMLSSAPVVRRHGYRFTFIVGLVLMAGGMALLASGPFSQGIVAVAVLGFGHGITTPAGNLRTADINPGRSASALNIINAVWGLGAMSSPLLLKIATHRPSWFLYGTAIALSALLLAHVLVRFVPDSHAEKSYLPNLARSVWRSRMLPVICILFFIYVGAETSFGGWVATYAHRVGLESSTFWTMAPSFFYGAMLVGRASAPLALKRLPEVRVAEIGLTLALLGGVTLVSARSMAPIVTGSFLAGVGLASIFPISVSLFPRWFSEDARRASGAIFASGNLGGAVLPWLVGVVSTYSGSLRLALFVPLLSVAAMLGFYLTNSSQVPRSAAGATSKGVGRMPGS